MKYFSPLCCKAVCALDWDLRLRASFDHVTRTIPRTVCVCKHRHAHTVPMDHARHMCILYSGGAIEGATNTHVCSVRRLARASAVDTFQ
jgi:hypothetical protein